MNKFIKIINDKNNNIIFILPCIDYYFKLLFAKKLKKFIKILSIFNKFNELLKYNARIRFNINTDDINCQLITKIRNKIIINKPFIIINDIIVLNKNLKFNYNDISALIGHEFGHLYHRKNYSNDLPIWPHNKMWDDEFYADMYCTQFLQHLNIDKFALLRLHQKMLKYRYDDDTETLNHPSMSHRIEMLQHYIKK